MTGTSVGGGVGAQRRERGEARRGAACTGPSARGPGARRARARPPPAPSAAGSDVVLGASTSRAPRAASSSSSDDEERGRPRGAARTSGRGGAGAAGDLHDVAARGARGHVERRRRAARPGSGRARPRGRPRPSGPGRAAASAPGGGAEAGGPRRAAGRRRRRLESQRHLLAGAAVRERAVEQRATISSRRSGIGSEGDGRTGTSLVSSMPRARARSRRTPRPPGSRVRSARRRGGSGRPGLPRSCAAARGRRRRAPRGAPPPRVPRAPGAPPRSTRAVGDAGPPGAPPRGRAGLRPRARAGRPGAAPTRAAGGSPRAGVRARWRPWLRRKTAWMSRLPTTACLDARLPPWVLSEALSLSQPRLACSSSREGCGFMLPAGKGYMAHPLWRGSSRPYMEVRCLTRAGSIEKGCPVRERAASWIPRGGEHARQDRPDLRQGHLTLHQRRPCGLSASVGSRCSTST